MSYSSVVVIPRPPTSNHMVESRDFDKSVNSRVTCSVSGETSEAGGFVNLRVVEG